jgi:hypothetical protein
MEVGRVGDLRIRDGSIVRLPLVGDRLYGPTDKRKPSMKETLKANSASRWSAVGCSVDTTKKNGLTRASLLMEVADDPRTGQPISGALSARTLIRDERLRRFHVPSP